MPDAHKNFAYSTVATAPSPASSGTSLIVQAGDGAKFPTPPFNAVIWPAGTQPLASNAEVVRVTAIATDTLTITRAQEGSSARSVVVGDQISAAITAKLLTDIEINPRQYIWLPSGWGSRWKSIKAAGPGTVWFVGDSYFQGSSTMANIIADRVATRFKNGYITGGPGLGGEFFPIIDDSGWLGGWSAAGTPPWVLNDNTHCQLQYVGFGRATQWGTAGFTNPLATFTSPQNVTDLDVVITDLVNAATVTFTVDGASGATFTLVNGGSASLTITSGATATVQVNLAGDSATKIIKCTGLTSGARVVTFTTQSAVNVFALQGCVVYTSRTTGLSLAHLTGTGAGAGNMSGIASIRTAFSNTALTPVLAKPDLVIIGFGINDAGNNTVAQYQDGLAWLYRAIMRAQPLCDVLMFMHFDPDASSDTATVYGNNANYHEYVGAAFSFAQANGLGWLNMGPRWGETPTASGFYNASANHPSSSGHADMYSALQLVL